MRGAEEVSNLSHATHVVACSVSDSTGYFGAIYKWYVIVYLKIQFYFSSRCF